MQKELSIWKNREDIPWDIIISETLKQMNADLMKILNYRVRFRELEGLVLRIADPIALMYQTGYLTIKDYDFRSDMATLGVPNKEVRESLFEGLLPYYLKLKHLLTIRT